MRHLGSLLLGAVGAPMLYLALGLGTEQLDRATRRLAGGSPSGSLNLVVGLGLVLVAAGWLWALVGIRFSPVGPALAGIGLAVLAVLTVTEPTQVARVLPAEVLGITGLRSAPPSALLLVALPLLGTLLSKRRWRGPRGDQPYSDHPIDATF